MWRFESNFCAYCVTVCTASNVHVGLCYVFIFCVALCAVIFCSVIVTHRRFGPWSRFPLNVGKFIPDTSQKAVVSILLHPPVTRAQVTASHVAAVQCGPARNATQCDLARTPLGALTYKVCQNVLLRGHVWKPFLFVLWQTLNICKWKLSFSPWLVHHNAVMVCSGCGGMTPRINSTHTNKCTYIVFNYLKFTLKHLKRSYMFWSYDHPQGAYCVPC